MVIQSGDQGENVRRLQHALNRFGFNLGEDGIFGSETETAVRTFQEQNNLDVDGQAGPDTLRALGLDPDTLEELPDGGNTGHDTDPDREGTFIIPDIFPGDLGANPPFQALPGLTANGKEVIGCIVKASEGTGWGSANEEWFKRSWQAIRDVAADRYGVDFFRGCYHFLRFATDGAPQADYFCDLVDAAGGWGDGDLMPWVDIEEGGQGTWAPQKLETIQDPALRERLAGEVTTCANDFITRFKERTGLRIAVYGRGVFRDLQMTNGKFNADAVVNPAYTVTMPRMEQYGVALDDIILWQLKGDDAVAAPGFPLELPGWGAKGDYSVYINGAEKTTLKTLRERCLSRSQ